MKTKKIIAFQNSSPARQMSSPDVTTSSDGSVKHTAFSRSMSFASYMDANGGFQLKENKGLPKSVQKAMGVHTTSPSEFMRLWNDAFAFLDTIHTHGPAVKVAYMVASDMVQRYGTKITSRGLAPIDVQANMGYYFEKFKKKTSESQTGAPNLEGHSRNTDATTEADAEPDVEPNLAVDQKALNWAVFLDRKMLSQYVQSNKAHNFMVGFSTNSGSPSLINALAYLNNVQVTIYAFEDASEKASPGCQGAGEKILKQIYTSSGRTKDAKPYRLLYEEKSQHYYRLIPKDSALRQPHDTELPPSSSEESAKKPKAHASKAPPTESAATHASLRSDVIIDGVAYKTFPLPSSGKNNCFFDAVNLNREKALWQIQQMVVPDLFQHVFKCIDVPERTGALTARDGVRLAVETFRNGLSLDPFLEGGAVTLGQVNQWFENAMNGVLGSLVMASLKGYPGDHPYVIGAKDLFKDYSDSYYTYPDYFKPYLEKEKLGPLLAAISTLKNYLKTTPPLSAKITDQDMAMLGLLIKALGDIVMYNLPDSENLLYDRKLRFSYQDAREIWIKANKMRESLRGPDTGLAEYDSNFKPSLLRKQKPLTFFELTKEFSKLVGKWYSLSSDSFGKHTVSYGDLSYNNDKFEDRPNFIDSLINHILENKQTQSKEGIHNPHRRHVTAWHVIRSVATRWYNICNTAERGNILHQIGLTEAKIRQIKFIPKGKTAADAVNLGNDICDKAPRGSMREWYIMQFLAQNDYSNLWFGNGTNNENIEKIGSQIIGNLKKDSSINTLTNASSNGAALTNGQVTQNYWNAMVGHKPSAHPDAFWGLLYYMCHISNDKLVRSPKETSNLSKRYSTACPEWGEPPAGSGQSDDAFFNALRNKAAINWLRVEKGVTTIPTPTTTTRGIPEMTKPECKEFFTRLTKWVDEYS